MRSKDGFVCVVSENSVPTWRGPDDVLYSSEQAIAAARGSLPGTSSGGGAVTISGAGDGLLRSRGESWRQSRADRAGLRCGPGSALLTSAGGDAPTTETYTLGKPEDYPTLAFPEEDYEIEEEFREVRVARYPRLFARTAVSATVGGGSARRRGPGRAG